MVSGGYVGGELDVNGGTIAPAASGSVGTLNVAGAMNINSGTVLVTLNTGLGTNWVDVPGTGASTRYTTPLDNRNG